jgi:hypothetical protein
MTDPITPPPELMSKWCYEDGEEIKSSPRWFFSVCAKAAQWGADQELEACCALMELSDSKARDFLQSARRPKPPSLKERALQAWAAVEAGTDDQTAMAVIRRALEALPE